MTAFSLKAELVSLANPAKAELLGRYFKTGKGQYGEGDVFLGLTVPVQRRIARMYRGMPLSEIQKLIADKYHEVRLTGFMILVEAMKCAGTAEQKKIALFYLKNARRANNWDLVDSTARDILGRYLYDKKRDTLYKLVKSRNIWERRIAIISTFYFINRGQFDDALAISKILLNDTHDLIHKAVGWMLREVGKKDAGVLRSFLDTHVQDMPRTMLRYAIEKFSDKERKEWLRK